MVKVARVQTALRDAAQIATVWKENPSFTVGSLNLDGFNAIHNAAQTLNNDCLEREDELIGLKKNRDDQARLLQDVVTRFRGAARAHFGPDSAQYAQSGGTPTSARKSSAHRARPESGKPEPVKA